MFGQQLLKKEFCAGVTSTISLLDHNVFQLHVVQKLSSACLHQLHFNQIIWWNTESIRIRIVPWAPMMLCSLGPFPPAEHSSMICRHMGPPHLPKETRAQAIYICNWVESNCAGSPSVKAHVCVFVHKHTMSARKNKVNYDLLWHSTKSV